MSQGGIAAYAENSIKGASISMGKMIQLNMELWYYDFSAHTDYAGLKTTVRRCKNADAIFSVNGYDTEGSLSGFNITLTVIQLHRKMGMR